MNSLFSTSSLLLPSPSCRSLPSIQSKPHYICTFYHQRHVHNFSPLYCSQSRRSNSLPTHHMSIGASDQGTVSVINFEDFIEKDWSFLDSDDLNSKEHVQKIDQIISAGEIDKTSRVLVSIGSESFVDRVAESSPCNLLLVVHDSLFMLAGIKEKYDKVKCWQGEVIYVPEKWAPLDVIFLYFLPGLPFKLDQVLEAIANRCLPGARVVISHSQGREVLEQQRKQFPDVVISELPDQTTTQKVAANHSFQVATFVDEPDLYLVVLKFCKARNLD